VPKKINWKNIRNYGSLLALIALMIFLGIASDRFFSARNLTNILRQASVVGIMGVGMTFVILTGGIDLSVGSTLALSGCVGAWLMKGGMDWPIALILSLLLGALLGFTNGFFIVSLNIPPFIATLGMMGVSRGFTYILTKGAPIYGFAEGYRNLGNADIFSIPIPAIIMLLLYLVYFILQNRTKFGRFAISIGANEEAAFLSGIPIKKYLLLFYMNLGLLAALSGNVMAARLDAAMPTAAQGYELDVIAAVVIGGTSLSGGQGTVIGTLIGALIMAVVRNGLNLLLVSTYWQQVIIGFIVIGAVAFDVLNKKIKN